MEMANGMVRAITSMVTNITTITSVRLARPLERASISLMLSIGTFGEMRLVIIGMEMKIGGATSGCPAVG